MKRFSSLCVVLAVVFSGFVATPAHARAVPDGRVYCSGGGFFLIQSSKVPKLYKSRVPMQIMEIGARVLQPYLTE